MATFTYAVGDLVIVNSDLASGYEGNLYEVTALPKTQRAKYVVTNVLGGNPMRATGDLLLKAPQEAIKAAELKKSDGLRLFEVGQVVLVDGNKDTLYVITGDRNSHQGVYQAYPLGGASRAVGKYWPKVDGKRLTVVEPERLSTSL